MSDSPSAKRAKSYREEAKRLREKAAKISAPDIREEFEKIARQYELMANNLDPVEKKPPKSG